VISGLNVNCLFSVDIVKWYCFTLTVSLYVVVKLVRFIIDLRFTLPIFLVKKNFHCVYVKTSAADQILLPITR